MARRGLVAACVVWMTSGCASDEDEGSNGEGGGNESDAVECENANENAPCAAPGEICSNGDDCGSWTYECQNGAWVQVDGSGCGLEPIACSASPIEGDGCGEMWYEECDRDGDCQDLLQCDSFEWVVRAVCCAELAPEVGMPCDEPWRTCDIEEECGERRYVCRDGVWTLSSDCD